MNSRGPIRSISHPWQGCTHVWKRMNSVNGDWMSDSFQPVPALQRLDEQRPRVLQVRDHDHRDQRGAQLKPAIVAIFIAPSSQIAAACPLCSSSILAHA